MLVSIDWKKKLGTHAEPSQDARKDSMAAQCPDSQDALTLY